MFLMYGSMENDLDCNDATWKDSRFQIIFYNANNVASYKCKSATIQPPGKYNSRNYHPFKSEYQILFI